MMAIWREIVIGLGLFWFGGAPVVIAETEEAPELTAEELEAAAVEITTCNGALTQGGLIICTGQPGAKVRVDGIVYEMDMTGHAYIGIQRNAPDTFTMQTVNDDPMIGVFTGVFTIAPRHDEESVISGIDCDKIDARTDEQKAHAGRSWVKKVDAWKIFHTGVGASEGFLRPAEGIVSSPFGFIRKYVTEGCETRIKPHFGYDIAAPTGAPIIAPASGTVILAEDDLYYEGGTVFLDHGGGLVSLFLHMSKLNVNVGDVIEAGDLVGEVGASGRVTGPHLHWAVKWRNPDTTDRSGDFYIDPALLLELPRAE